MAIYYTFKNKKSFVKSNTQSFALDQKMYNGQPSPVFRHIDGIPNPWFCHRLLGKAKYERNEDGSLKVYTNSDIDHFMSEYIRE